MSRLTIGRLRCFCPDQNRYSRGLRLARMDEKHFTRLSQERLVGSRHVGAAGSWSGGPGQLRGMRPGPRHYDPMPTDRRQRLAYNPANHGPSDGVVPACLITRLDSGSLSVHRLAPARRIRTAPTCPEWAAASTRGGSDPNSAPGSARAPAIPLAQSLSQQIG
jgi:hypothetical protein